MNSYYEKMVDTGEVKCIDEEIPFEVPEGWEWCRLVSLFLHTSGKQQSSNNKSGGTPKKFITTSNLYWGYFNLDNVKVMNFTEDEIMSCSATKGDLLVCEGGAGYGRSAIWDKEYDICLQNHIHRLRPLVKGLCEYVYHFIYFFKESNQLASVGTAMPGLSANRLKNLLVPLPPISEQERIVVKLKTLMPHVEKYAASKNILDELNKSVYSLIRKSILQEAVQGKLVPQYSDEGTANELLDAIREEKLKLVRDGKLKKKDIVDSVIFKGDDNKYYEQVGNNTCELDIDFSFPDSWSILRLNDICQLTDGEKRDVNGIYMDAKFLRSKSTGKYFDKGKFVYKGDDIILVDGENSGEVFSVPIDGYMGSTFKQLWISTEVYKPFILLFILYFKDKLRNSKKGAAIPHLNKDVFYNLLIGIPPLLEQERIVCKVNNLFKLDK